MAALTRSMWSNTNISFSSYFDIGRRTKKKKNFDKKVKIKTLFKYAHRHTHTHGGDWYNKTHTHNGQKRSSFELNSNNTKTSALLFCRVVVCLLIISLISSDFNLTRHFETLKKKKNRLPREWVCVFSCAEFFFWETLNSKQIKNTGGYFILKNLTRFLPIFCCCWKATMLQAGTNERDENKIFKWWYQKKIDTSRHTHWIENKKKATAKKWLFLFYTGTQKSRFKFAAFE